MSGNDDARELLEAVSGFTEQAPERDESSATKPVRMATVAGGYSGSGDATVIFDGETTPGARTYVTLATIAAGDRVALLPVGNGYVVIGAVGGGFDPGPVEADVLALDGRVTVNEGDIADLEAREAIVRVAPSSLANTGGSVSVDAFGLITLTNVSSFSLLDAFTAEFLNYEGILNIDSASGAASYNFRFGASTTDDTSGYTAVYGENNNGAGWGGGPTSDRVRAGRMGGNGCYGTFMMFSPFSASTRSRMKSESHDSDGYWDQATGSITTAKQHKRMTIYTSGVTFSGTFQLRGLR